MISRDFYTIALPADHIYRIFKGDMTELCLNQRIKKPWLEEHSWVGLISYPQKNSRYYHLLDSPDPIWQDLIKIDGLVALAQLSAVTKMLTYSKSYIYSLGEIIRISPPYCFKSRTLLKLLPDEIRDDFLQSIGWENW